MERILVLDGSLGDGMIALVSRTDGVARLQCSQIQAGRGGAERLAGGVRDLLDAQGWPVASLWLIAAVTGPGSFTGLRASLALAHGMALGQGTALQGVRRGEAIRRQLGAVDDRILWCVGMARRDRVFLERCEQPGEACAAPEAHGIDELPLPDRPVVLAGDARRLVADRLFARGVLATCSEIERPDAISIAMVACDQQEGSRPAHAALPLYVDPPEARLPAAGLRPKPA